MTRDSQRAAVYAAEHQLARIIDRSADHPMIRIAGSTIAVPAERKFGDIASAQRYVDAVLRLDWVAAAWPGPAARTVTVRSRRGTSRAHYETDVIAVPVAGDRWALRELVLLHELAHHLGDGDRAHGPGFCARLLALVDGVIATEAAFLLRVLLADQSASIGTVTP